MSNKSRGNEFERRFARMMSAHGWWVHLFRQTDAGQPCDLIAVRNHKAVIVDCKVCDTGVFKMSRIEENQKSSMQLWDFVGNGAGWFALELPDHTVWMFSSYDMANYEGTQMPEAYIRHYGIFFNDWLMDEDKT